MARHSSPLRSSLARLNRRRLHCEMLEDRNLLNCGPNGTMLEGFDNGDLNAYKTIVNYYSTAYVSEGAGCDGGLGLVDYDGDDWIIRQDGGNTISQGEYISAWVWLGGDPDGRTYLGFGAVTPQTNNRLTTGRTLSVVLAPNTNQFQIQMHLGYKFTGSNFAVLGSVPHEFAMDSWYRVEAYWFPGGAIWAALYDYEGTGLNFVEAQQPASFTSTSGGLAFRTFGVNSYALWDSVIKFDPFTGPIGGGQFRPPVHPNISLEEIRAQSNRWNGIGVQGAPYPFLYESTPGTDRDIQLDNISGLSHVSCSAAQCPDGTFGGMVGLTVTNTSRNMTNMQVPWGPSLVNHFSNDTPLKSPNFQMYMYRLDPGGEAIRIGESGIKAFWSSTDSDYQHIAPFSTDTYSTGHNSNRTSFSTLASLHPVTGERYDYSEMGDVNIHGIHVLRNRSFTNPFENLLQVDANELNPAFHPGARYFVAANIYVVGDRNVANNSRWLEYRLTQTGQNRYTFTTVGSQQLDICRIPGLTPIGRCAAGSPGGGDDTGLIPNLGQIDVTRILAQPLTGLTVVPAEPLRGPQQSLGVLPLDQYFGQIPSSVLVPAGVDEEAGNDGLPEQLPLEGIDFGGF